MTVLSLTEVTVAKMVNWIEPRIVYMCVCVYVCVCVCCVCVECKCE